MLDWSLYPNFTEEEMKCSHTGECNMHPEFMRLIQDLRKEFNRPLIITSAYRSPEHPIEAQKENRGEHTYGCAMDVAIRGGEAIGLVALAYSMGIRRIGVQQKGDGRFIHIGMGDKLAQFPTAMWSY